MLYVNLREEILVDDHCRPILPQIGGINFGEWEKKFNLAGINLSGSKILAT